MLNETFSVIFKHSEYYKCSSTGAIALHLSKLLFSPTKPNIYNFHTNVYTRQNLIKCNLSKVWIEKNKSYFPMGVRKPQKREELLQNDKSCIIFFQCDLLVFWFPGNLRPFFIVLSNNWWWKLSTILIKVEREAFISLLSAATVKKSSKPVVAVLQRPCFSLSRRFMVKTYLFRGKFLL